MDKGIGELESIETLKLPEFQIYGGTFKIINTYFGDKKRYLQAIKELEKELFTVAMKGKYVNYIICKKNSRYHSKRCWC